MSNQNSQPYPGEKLSNRDKIALARDNERITRQAQEQAMRHREGDIQSGRERPLVQVLADGIKGKLEREEFNK